MSFFSSKKQEELETRIQERFEHVRKHYKELDTTDIRLRFFPLFYATMEARPSIVDFITNHKKDKRKFIIMINTSEGYREYAFPLYNVSNEILDGWLAHELGHIVFYQTLSHHKLALVPLRFMFDKKYKKFIESGADTLAEQHGFKQALHKGIELRLNDPSVSQEYKERLRKFYKVK
jgi:hypothetical protein